LALIAKPKTNSSEENFMKKKIVWQFLFVMALAVVPASHASVVTGAALSFDGSAPVPEPPPWKFDGSAPVPEPPPWKFDGSAPVPEPPPWKFDGSAPVPEPIPFPPKSI
jgi:hypothetical protein